MRIALLPTLLLVGACSGSSDTGTTGKHNGGNSGDSADTGEYVPPPWQPATGTWNVTQGDVLKDTCHFPEGSNDTALPTASTMDIVDAEDHLSITITIPSTDGSEPLVVTCPRTDYAYHCDLADVADSETAGQYGMNATILLTIDEDGEFSDENNVAGSYTYGVDCRGQDCDTVARVISSDFSFPCGGQVAFTAQYAGAPS